MQNQNLSNPEKLVNEARLNEYHQTILPYLGGHIECGFTPVGAVIMMSGNEAPKHYLKCDGTVYNIADYPELAAFYARSQGRCNFYGGNGTTTFAVPDLRGEFLRGTGTNSHANQGSGANVGTHQDATTSPYFIYYNVDNKIYMSGKSVGAQPVNTDSLIGNSSNTGRALYNSSSTDTYVDPDNRVSYTSRPTNTSVLFCVASKNIYLDARFDYSLEEKVVGEWIDGKPLYQKTIVPSTATPLPNKTNFTISTGITANVIETLVDMTGIIKETTNGGQWRTLPQIQDTDANMNCTYQLNKDGSTIAFFCRNGNLSMYDIKHITLLYTKTTDT